MRCRIGQLLILGVVVMQVAIVVLMQRPESARESAPGRAVSEERFFQPRELEMVPVVTPTPVATAVSPPSSSTVTQSALTATVTAYTVIDPVPATPVATPARVVTEAQQSIKSYEPWPAYLWPTVACIVQRESRGDPYAVGSAGERGLMQVHPVTWPYLAQYGITPDSLFDPTTNIRAGYLLYQVNGLAPWGGGCS